VGCAVNLVDAIRGKLTEDHLPANSLNYLKGHPLRMSPRYPAKGGVGLAVKLGSGPINSAKAFDDCFLTYLKIAALP
ncbi:MAG: hypothetical protein ACI9TA_003165, partial [Reinekea sp.]